jgi:hypothetical protein
MKWFEKNGVLRMGYIYNIIGKQIDDRREGRLLVEFFVSSMVCTMGMVVFSQL